MQAQAQEEWNSFQSLVLVLIASCMQTGIMKAQPQVSVPVKRGGGGVVSGQKPENVGHLGPDGINGKLEKVCGDPHLFPRQNSLSTPCL